MLNLWQNRGPTDLFANQHKKRCCSKREHRSGRRRHDFEYEHEARGEGTRNKEQGTRNWELGTGNWELGTGNFTFLRRAAPELSNRRWHNSVCFYVLVLSAAVLVLDFHMPLWGQDFGQLLDRSKVSGACDAYGGFEHGNGNGGSLFAARGATNRDPRFRSATFQDTKYPTRAGRAGPSGLTLSAQTAGCCCVMQ